ncbi:meiosis-specific nuclear structural protein 1-like [Clavelina lepadiformis]|uniref:meiosis-specific nuclear structural protein 1-like n=1 Tax=Clavelina lepadiformis TaxID=159417 RepID=UPI0040431C28
MLASQRRAALTHAQQEKLRVENRRKENLREDFLKNLKDDALIKANMTSEDRVSDKRFIRRLQKEEQERSMEEAILKAEQNRIQREDQLSQEERLAKQLELVKLEKVRDEKMRQQIRDNSLELRELEAKLKAGYMNRERAAQIAEKEAIKIQGMQRDAEISTHMKTEHARAEKAEHEREMEKWQEGVRYQQELERQLEEKEHKKQEAYEEFLKEKLLIDEIVRKIYEEDRREQEMRLEKQLATQRFIEEFKYKREEWKRLERERLEEENRRILQFADLQQARENERMAKQQQQEDAKALVQQRLADEITQEQTAKGKREQILQDLYLEEQEEAERRKERAEQERLLRQRIELQETHAKQMEFKEMRKRAEQMEEEEFRKQMLAKFAEDDRIEQMNAQKRRMKQLEHKRAVEALLADRRRQFESDKQREIDELRDEEQMQAMRRQIIEEERQRLLKEHATKLLGYLPKGVLTSDRDLALFDESFQDAYRNRASNDFYEE